MFYLHLPIGLISSKKYWRVGRKLSVRFKRGNSSKILFSHFHKTFIKNLHEKRKIGFLKPYKKTICSENFDFRGLCVYLNTFFSFAMLLSSLYLFLKIYTFI